MSEDLYAGVRVHYVGHGDHTVSTCVYRTTDENKRACYAAIAALEGITYEDVLQALARNHAHIISVETYHSYGGVS